MLPNDYEHASERQRYHVSRSVREYSSADGSNEDYYQVSFETNDQG